ncbi:hypothetical protein ACP70R_005338 [Stipagrostis hirtigluma subsp. patula]
MEHQPHHTGGQGADSHVVDIELQPANVAVAGDGESLQQALQRRAVADANPHLSGERPDDSHDVAVDVAGAEDDDGPSCCLVCTEPMEWVAVGRCGHRFVCSRCMVRLRFFHQNRRCCVCRTRCPRVVVTRWDGACRDAAILSTLPLFALWEGRVGKYWYHRHTAAYFEDENEYKAAKAACEGILSPFYRPLYWFIPWLGFGLFSGVMLGYSYARHTKHLSSQVRAYALCIFVFMLAFTLVWSIPKCTQDPLEMEYFRKVDEEYSKQQYSCNVHRARTT